MKAIILLLAMGVPALAEETRPAPAQQPYVFDANRKLATQPPETDKEKAAREQMREQLKAKKTG